MVCVPGFLLENQEVNPSVILENNPLGDSCCSGIDFCCCSGIIRGICSNDFINVFCSFKSVLYHHFFVLIV